MIEKNPGYNKVFYADSGSDRVEVAVKMSLQYQLQTGNEQYKIYVSSECLSRGNGCYLSDW